jgi:hypothetical protein
MRVRVRVRMWDLGRKELGLELVDPSLRRQLELAPAEVVDIQQHEVLR